MARAGLAGWFAVACLAAGFVLPDAGAESPAQIFGADASGMLRFEVRCDHGRQQGSGFLLGPTLVMTARHVLVDTAGKSCAATVVQEGTHTKASVTRWMAIRTKAGKAPTDLALGVLDTPLTGHEFEISAASARKGERVIALGYALGQPLSVNQGHVVRMFARNHVRLMQLDVLEASGASGGPILDVDGRVLGLTQYGFSGNQTSVDLAALIHGHPAQLCFGVAKGEDSTICSATLRAAPILERDGPPPLCLGVAVDPPFSACTIDQAVQDSTGIVELTSSCPQSGHLNEDGFMLGPRLLMTSSWQLLDSQNGAKCTTTAKTASGKSIPVVRMTRLRLAGTRSAIDVALAVLAATVDGHAFSFRASPVTRGLMVHALIPILAGHRPSAMHVARLLTVSGTQVVEFKGDTSNVATGDPIVDSSDQVVGIAQVGSDSDVYSVDLLRTVNDDPTGFCVGVAAGQTSTVCPPARPGGVPLLERDLAVSVCGGSLAVPPFNACQGSASDPPTPLVGPKSGQTTDPFATVTPPPPPTITDCWVTSVNSFGGANRMADLPDTVTAPYFLWTLTGPAPSNASVALTATQPNGIKSIREQRSLDTYPSVSDGGTYKIQTSFTGSNTIRPPAGVWKLDLTLGTLGSCSVTVTVHATS